MKFEEVHSTVSLHLQDYCVVLFHLLQMRNDKTLWQSEKGSAIKRIIRETVREASNCVTPFGGKGKVCAQYITEAAIRTLGSDGSAELVYEHVIPVSVLNENILAKKFDSIDDIKNFILEYSITAVVTKDEDNRLGSLRNKMPKGSSIDNKFSRYEQVGIPKPQPMHEYRNSLLSKLRKEK